MAKKKQFGGFNAPWKQVLNSYASAGGQLGLKYLEGLASQYGVPYSQVVGFAQKQGFQIGTKAQSALNPTPAPAPVSSKSSQPKLKIKDVATLENYLKGNTFGSSIGKGDAVPGLAELASYMGVNKINSQQEIKQALQILGGIQSPAFAAAAPKAGITNYNSLNDYLKVLGGGATQPAAAPPPPAESPVTTPTSQTPKTPKGPSAADAILAMADQLVAQMNDQDAMAQLASEQQAKIQQEAARTLAANLARSRMMPNLQIQPATGVSKLAGTQGFRRRSDQFNLQPIGALGTISGLSSATPAIINI